jgi:hypothetical protein
MAQNTAPEGFHDDGSSIDSQIACDNCGITVTIGVAHGENYQDHQCYSDSYDETGGIPASGF